MTSQSSSFELLAPPLKRWIYQQGWESLRDIQESGIPVVLEGGDVILAGSTASGKTEAAFLPLLTRILSRENMIGGFAAIYVAPLKALINDQFERLQMICDAACIAVTKWHSDAPAAAKERALKSPSGILLITPESLEAMLVRRGPKTAGLFAHLEAVVIDECHVFIGTERGVQLMSNLTRIEAACDRDRIDRIGLSATLGNLTLAAEALRPGSGDDVTIVERHGTGNALKLQVKGFIDPGTPAQTTDSAAPPLILEDVADYLIKHLLGGHHLLFAGSRRNVETYACALAERCVRAGVPNVFFAHHGNLSKAEREAVEERLRDDPRSTTAIATTTLGAGIDVGTVTSVVQIGPGASVAAVRQQAGRSGRRNSAPAIMRVVSIEPKVGPNHHPLDQLHLELVHAIANVECLIEGWCEAPPPAGLHLSTLLHQILALIQQEGGIRPLAAWSILCERGPFRNVDKILFAELLRHMADPHVMLIEPAPDQTLMLGRSGERLAQSHEFFAVFSTPEEYRVVAGAKTLGTYPVTSLVSPGQTIIFAGQRWEIDGIDNRARTIAVKPALVAMPPTFSGTWTGVDDHVVSKMRAVLSNHDTPPYLDRIAKEVLQNARAAFHRMGLRENAMIQLGDGILLLPWVGTRTLETFGLALSVRNLRPRINGHAIEIPKMSLAEMTRILEAIANSIPSGDVLASSVATPAREKFDGLLSPALLRKVVLAERLDLESIPWVAARLVGAHA